MAEANSINAATTGIVGNTGTSFTATPVTQYNILSGASTSSTINNIAPSATSGVPVISQGASSQPIFGTALIAGGGTAATSFNINGIVISNTTTTGALASLTMTNGQLIIGSTGNPPVAATLTAGTGVSITNASNAITVNAVGGGVTWTVTTVDASAVGNNGYIANKAGLLTMTLPASGTVGEIISITGINTALGWKIAQNANQQIFFGTSSTTLGATGSLASAAIRDTVTLVCVVGGASSNYNVVSSIGNISIV